MNARLQVEHPVTELVYGIDLVQWQLRIASGERLTLAQKDVRPRGWAIEARIYAEDPANAMLPSTGTIADWSPPAGAGRSRRRRRHDGQRRKPLLRSDARQADRLRQPIARRRSRGSRRSLEDFTIDGVRTNLPLLLWIARDEAFARGETTTSFLSERLDESIFARTSAAARSGAALRGGASCRRPRAVAHRRRRRAASPAAGRAPRRDARRRDAASRTPGVSRAIATAPCACSDADSTFARGSTSKAIDGAVTYDGARVQRASRRQHVAVYVRRAAVDRRGERQPRRGRERQRRRADAGKNREGRRARRGERRGARALDRARGDEDGAPHRSARGRDRENGARERGSDRRRRHPAGGARWSRAGRSGDDLPRKRHDLRDGGARRAAERTRADLDRRQGSLHRSALGDGLAVDRGHVVRQPQGDSATRRCRRSFRANSKGAGRALSGARAEPQGLRTRPRRRRRCDSGLHRSVGALHEAQHQHDDRRIARDLSRRRATGRTRRLLGARICLDRVRLAVRRRRRAGRWCSTSASS